ncbi:MAG: hypothetical protein ACREV4_01300 [Gammaproteobacteria bacterium]
MKKFIIIAVVLFVLANIVGMLTKPDKKVAGPTPESGVSTPPRSRSAP